MKKPTQKPPKAGRAPRAGKRALNKERNRQAILKAALEVFSKKGFFKATTREIARKAGIAEGTLFNYFHTKEDLALYFFERELDGMIEWFESQERLGKAPLPERLFAIIHHHLERLSPYEEFIGAVCLRALQPDSKLHPLSLESQQRHFRYLSFVRGILAEAEDKGELPRLGAVGAYVFGLFHLAMVMHWLHDRSPGKEETLALLDRSLQVFSSFLARKGGWEW
jgi:AcrR family transcriptional regulator